jgi:cyclic 2,3-diphosphoglycerate synthetase
VLLEGSGAAAPPVVADRTVLVTSAHTPSEALMSGFGPVRVLRSQLVVITMAEQGADDTREAIDAVAPGLPAVAVRLAPRPAEPLGPEPVAFFTTAAAMRASALADQLDAEVTAVIPALSDRAELRAALERPEVREAGCYLVEIKAAAIDVVCEAAEQRGVRVVFCDNQPVPLDGEPDLDAALLELAAEAVAAHA